MTTTTKIIERIIVSRKRHLWREGNKKENKLSGKVTVEMKLLFEDVTALEEVLDVYNREVEKNKVTVTESNFLLMEKEEYTSQQLDDAFELVRPKPNWKYNINKVLPKDTDIKLIEEAIIYRCGCCADFETLKNGKIRVTAVGYYIAVGA